ncbi:MAG: DNA glycosylase AlkZ-like family protein [Rubrivivax sp.]
MAKPPALTLQHLRQHAVARSLFKPTSLPQALQKLGFVQADPIRAPARAQDLTLRQRVKGYRAGDLDRRYPQLPLEEDFFVNYGFLPRELAALMHPRTPETPWDPTRWAQAHAVLDFVRERGVVHPREVDAAFQHGKAKNWFGGNSNASTQLLDSMHYRGLLRTARREGGTRLYAVRPPQAEPANPHAALDRLADLVLNQCAPLPEPTLNTLVRRIRYGAPQHTPHMSALLARTKARLPHAVVDGTRWYWPADENPASKRHGLDEQVRLLAPFDPVVWDRHRFELFWGWAYRFEAYTPAPKRVRGYYALPLLWRGQVIGWGNLSVVEGRLVPDLGYVSGRAPADAAYGAALDEELQRLSTFLGLD